MNYLRCLGRSLFVIVDGEVPMSNTAIYPLLKYSRPSEDMTRLDEQPTSTDAQWQHFANPTLSLYTETGPNGSLRSARVRIVWTNSRQENQSNSPDTVTLEDIDLLSFPTASSLSSMGQKLHGKSLPLKAVYRDSVVGLRYLHPLVFHECSTPTYRRFQMSFTEPSFAARFVDGIRQVCPCKASPLKSGPTPHSQAVVKPPGTASAISFTPSSATRQSLTVLPDSSPDLSSRTFASSFRTFVHDVPIQYQSSQPSNSSGAVRVPSKPLHSSLPPQPSPRSSFKIAASGAPHSDSIHRPPPVPTLEDISSSPLVDHLRRDVNVPSNPERENKTHGFTQSKSPILCSSPQPPVLHHEQPHIMPNALHQNTSNAFSETQSISNPSVSSCGLLHRNPNSNDQVSSPKAQLVQHDALTSRELYDIPVDQLERFVGEVVREHGFPKFLEQLDNMWKLKGFISRN